LLPGSPQGWVALSPPRTPVLRYHEVEGDTRAASTDTAQYAERVMSPTHATNCAASPLASGRYAAARVDLSSQLSAMEADMAGLETAAHRTFGSAVDRYHSLIVRRSTPKRALQLKQQVDLDLNAHSLPPWCPCRLHRRRVLRSGRGPRHPYLWWYWQVGQTLARTPQPVDRTNTHRDTTSQK
jgi:hypothetical protein